MCEGRVANSNDMLLGESQKHGSFQGGGMVGSVLQWRQTDKNARERNGCKPITAGSEEICLMVDCINCQHAMMKVRILLKDKSNGVSFIVYAPIEDKPFPKKDVIFWKAFNNGFPRVPCEEHPLVVMYANALTTLWP